MPPKQQQPPKQQRRQTVSVDCESMDDDDFLNAMVNALSHERVIHALRSAITNELKGELINLKTLLEKKDEEFESLKTRVGELEYQHDELQQYSRRNSIRVSGLVETPNEDPAELSIDLFNNRMHLAIIPEEIDRAHRVGKMVEGKDRPLLVKFTSYRARRSVIGARRTLRDTGEDRPKVFINEDLTQKRATLLFKARTKKREKMIQDCWSYDGRIVILDNVSKIHTVINDEELTTHCRPKWTFPQFPS